METKVLEALRQARKIIHDEWLICRYDKENIDYLKYLTEQMQVIDNASHQFEHNYYKDDYDGGDALDPYPEREFPTAEND